MFLFDIESLLLFRQLKAKPELFVLLAKNKDRKIRLKVAQRKDATAEALDALADDCDDIIRRLVARNKNTSRETLKKLSFDADLKVRTGVVENNSTDADTLEGLSFEECLDIDRALSSKSTAPGHILGRLVHHNDDIIRVNLARNPNISFEYLWEMANDSNKQVRSTVFKRLSQSKEIVKALTHFSKDDDENIRSQVAIHPQLSTDLLKTLSNDQEAWVRRNIVEHQDLSADMTEAFSYDTDLYVRASIAKQPTENTELLRRLSKDKEEHVRCAVAKNPSTPLKILKALSRDKSIWVIRALATNEAVDIELLTNLLRKHIEDKQVSRPLKNRIFNLERLQAQNPLTPKPILASLVKSEFNKIHEYLAENSSTAEKTLRELAQKGTISCKIKLLERPDLENDIFELIMKDSVCKERVLISSSTNPDILQRYYCLEQELKCLQSLASNTATDLKFLHKLGQHEDKIVRQRVARNTNTSEMTLRYLMHDKNESVRKLVALNKNTPDDAINTLILDTSQQVRLNLLRQDDLTDNQIRRLALGKDNKFRKKIKSTILNEYI
ncbi:HEAT repeat domain-containing protein [Hellea balneolensis]|uniref:HEAT repeat domain-containing protein n=1 Tax=Hellea balneolensis TaxID=287478 RepID=UPI0004291FD1|nr:hypothetical protein [Hellea balneolensis]